MTDVSTESHPPNKDNDAELVRVHEESKRHEVTQNSKIVLARWAAFKAIGVTIVGTFALGVVAAYLNYQIQSRQLEVEREKTKRELSIKEATFRAEDERAKRQLEQEYLRGFVDEALSEDIQRRVDFAKYIAEVTLNPEIRKVWKDYHKSLEVELKETRIDQQNSAEQLEMLNDLVRKLAREKMEEPLHGQIGLSASAILNNFSRPVDGDIVRKFSEESDGIDISAETGSPVLATASGTVAATTEGTDMVPIVVIRHDYNMMSIYANMQNVLVVKGDVVKRNQKIGEVRDFLHFEIRENFGSLDPLPYIK